MAKGWRWEDKTVWTDGPRQGWGSGGVVGGGPHPSALDTFHSGWRPAGQLLHLGDSKGVPGAEVYANYQVMRILDARNDTGATNGRLYQTDRYYQLLSGRVARGA